MEDELGEVKNKSFT